MIEPQTVDSQKKALRKQMLALRRRVSATHGATAAETLARMLSFPAGIVVGAYWPLGDEIDPRPLMAALERAGCRLALPVVVAKAAPLEFRAFRMGDTLEPGMHGTVQPEMVQPVLFPEILLVPLLAFDRGCFRLGYGGGYYDRTLEKLRQKVQVKSIGIGFAAQEVPAVPRDGHDQRLDSVATEQGVFMAERA